jgi:outer membrane protein assembly factor BamB
MLQRPHGLPAALLLAWWCIALGPAALPAQEWTRFRGPNGTGVSVTTGVPVTWTTADFRWRVPLPGKSHAQPVIWGERVFLPTATAQGNERILLCLRRDDGSELWRHTYALPTGTRPNPRASFANESAAVDARRVIALFVSSDHFWVRAFDHDGRELWARDLGPFQSRHGHASSPILVGDRVIVNNDQDGPSFVAALDAETGATVWTLPGESRPDHNTFATPFTVERSGHPPELIVSSQQRGLAALDPATGTVRWQAQVLVARSVASPILAGDLIVACWGFGPKNVLGAFRHGGDGDVSETHLAYVLRERISYVPTPLHHEGRIYLVNDAGVASALDAVTGRVLWAERLAVGEFYSSGVLAEGRLYCASAAGEMFVLAADDTFRLLARNPLGEGTHSTPCLDRGRMYVKTFTHLVCVGGQ